VRSQAGRWTPWIPAMAAGPGRFCSGIPRIRGGKPGQGRKTSSPGMLLRRALERSRRRFTMGQEEEWGAWPDHEHPGRPERQGRPSRARARTALCRPRVRNGYPWDPRPSTTRSPVGRMNSFSPAGAGTGTIGRIGSGPRPRFWERQVGRDSHLENSPGDQGPSFRPGGCAGKSWPRY
jgi:hypothetical protein